MDRSSHSTKAIVDHLFREEAGKMTAILIRLFGFGNAELAEDIVQETFITAMKNWPMKGVPEKPSAWLMQVAKNKAINVIKREQLIRKKAPAWLEVGGDESAIENLFQHQEIKDSQLNMLFTCCYPEIKEREQLMLILKILGGFSYAEIGSALLMKPEAVKKALYRARKEIKNHYVELPELSPQEALQRVDTVLKAIYLLFNEGYKTSYANKLINVDLCFTALRLAHLMTSLTYDDSGRVHALLALMYFQSARFSARSDHQSVILDLKDQDRAKWSRELINKGFNHLKRSRESKELSRYHLESTIASVHIQAPSFEETDWKLISTCYERLINMEPSPIIELNYIVALSYLRGAELGLKKLEKLQGSITQEKEYFFWAAKAEMNVRLGKFGLAKSYYQVACDLTPSGFDETYLRRKMEECDLQNLSKN
ncbi:RNA polymerase sigma factor [Gracilimonas sediminicola]|uniref:RNA polymerase sigma factor n=1 Tax=Gracilimonas sediminicola TaxID=2952158 RepID=A0A9X2L2B0_9BACT|nr:sigma-70 family RNA polymerase sigma factor [Gracilimonas sediminicola]MCP9291016.1 sigma-70 family RNA polymerase sigma factor [Gracilimonas sediminicola]